MNEIYQIIWKWIKKILQALVLDSKDNRYIPEGKRNKY
jgi:hypothetical protein